jgi:hypothetical protein
MNASGPRRHGAPFLRSVDTLEERVVPGRHPFDIPAFREGIHLRLKTKSEGP